MFPSVVLMQTADGAEMLQVGDTTLSLIVLDEPIDKAKLERCQLDHFNALAASQRPELAVEIVSPGDRPDFRVSRNGGQFGLDVAAFAFTARRQAVAQFRDLKTHLQNAYKSGRLRGCRGVQVQVTFGAPGGRPPRKFDASTIEELINAFDRLVINHDAWDLAARSDWVMGEVANPFPMGETGRTADGIVEWYVPGLVSMQSNFTRTCHFQVEHCYLETVTKDDVRIRLDEIVAQHDKPGQGIDELIIVAGGPDLHGEGVAEEAVILDTFINHWSGEIAHPQVIRRILVDNWQANRVHVLYER